LREKSLQDFDKENVDLPYRVVLSKKLHPSSAGNLQGKASININFTDRNASGNFVLQRNFSLFLMTFFLNIRENNTILFIKYIYK
jgi:hypothetical protein